jgi:hypothetical protein
MSCSGSSFADGETLNGGLLLGHAESGLVGLGDFLGSLDTVELNVRVGGEVWGDTTVGSVGSSTARDGALHDDVVDDALVDVQLAGLSVSLKVDKEFTDSLGGLLGPSSLFTLEDLALGVTAKMTIEPSEGDDALVLNYGVQVSDGGLDLHSLASACSLVSVLKMAAEIRNSRLSGCKQRRTGQTRNVVKRDNEMRKVVITYTLRAQRAV